MNFSTTERQQLAELFIAKGPDAPTLCGGWTTRDLAAHLWVREHRPLAQLRSMLPKSGDSVDEETSKALARPYYELVQAWAGGPTGVNPWKILDPVANGVEHFIHHEDVRRGALTPGDPIAERELPEDHQRYLHRALKLVGARALKADRPIILNPEGLSRITVNDKPGVSHDGESVIRIDGTVGEILLWISGRDVVNLKFSGDNSSVERMSL